MAEEMCNNVCTKEGWWYCTEHPQDELCQDHGGHLPCRFCGGKK